LHGVVFDILYAGQRCARELLSSRDDAELRRVLDRVGGVAAGIDEPDDLGLRALRLQRERGESSSMSGKCALQRQSMRMLT
jgi:hypothetical protein